MNIRKLLVWALVIGLVLVVVHEPNRAGVDAAGIVNHLFGWAKNAGSAAVTFLHGVTA